MIGKKDKKTISRRPVLRVAGAVLVVCSCLKLLGYLISWIIATVSGGISFSLTKASSIGIIGGADGPTSIFVATAAAPLWRVIGWSMLLILGIVCFLFSGKSQQP